MSWDRNSKFAHKEMPQISVPNLPTSLKSILSLSSSISLCTIFSLGSLFHYIHYVIIFTVFIRYFMPEEAYPILPLLDVLVFFSHLVFNDRCCLYFMTLSCPTENPHAALLKVSMKMGQKWEDSRSQRRGPAWVFHQQ